MLTMAPCLHNDTYTIDTDTQSDTPDDSNTCGIWQITSSYACSNIYLPHLHACARPTADNTARSTTAEVLIFDEHGVHRQQNECKACSSTLQTSNRIPETDDSLLALQRHQCTEAACNFGQERLAIRRSCQFALHYTCNKQFDRTTYLMGPILFIRHCEVCCKCSQCAWCRHVLHLINFFLSHKKLKGWNLVDTSFDRYSKVSSWDIYLTLLLPTL